MSTTSVIARNARELTNAEGSFPAQEQEPPGLTGEMSPQPDHGEQSYRGCGRLEGLCALITGGDSGIGRAAPIAFAREGADVAIGYLPVEQPAAQLGGLDVLVNNAGYQHARGAGLQTLDTENLDRAMKTNLYATIWASQEALEFLREGSSIINTTSIQAYQPARRCWTTPPPRPP